MCDDLKGFIWKQRYAHEGSFEMKGLHILVWEWKYAQDDLGAHYEHQGWFGKGACVDMWLGS